MGNPDEFPGFAAVAEKDGAGLAGAYNSTIRNLEQVRMLVCEANATKLTTLAQLPRPRQTSKRAHDVLSTCRWNAHNGQPVSRASSGTKLLDT